MDGEPAEVGDYGGDDDDEDFDNGEDTDDGEGMVVMKNEAD